MFTHLFLLCLTVFVVTSDLKAASIADFKIPRDFRFTRDLYKGNTVAPDVFFLQNILNMSTSTRVAETGPGSLAAPTLFYGEKTRSAVGRFQALFATDIAYERANSTSTASSSFIISSNVVDQYTRAVLNKLIIVYSDDHDYSTATNTTSGVFSTSSNKFPTGQTGQNGSSDTPSASDKPESFIYKSEKLTFTYSPQGLILKAIGGSELVDKVFSYTPAGQIGKQLGLGGGSGSGGVGGGFGGGGSGGTSALQTFGGQTTSMINCTCSFNILLYVKDVRGQTIALMYQPGATVLYNNYRPTSGVNVLGQYTSGGQCLIYAGTSCSSGGSPQGTMTSLGTSLSI